MYAARRQLRLLTCFYRQELRNYGKKRIGSDVVIASAVRTPIGSFQGNYMPLSVSQLGAVAIDGALKQSRISPDDVQEVYFGNVLGSGLGQAPARQATLLAGLPKCVYCTTVNAASATGMKTIAIAAQALRLGHARAAVAGGMECVSKAPQNIENLNDVKMVNGVLRDGIVDPQYEHAAQLLGITHSDQLDYTRISVARARKACDAGIFEEELVPVRIQMARQPAVYVVNDEPFASARDRQALDSNAILGDGAAALVLTTMEAAEAWNLKPLARIIDYNEIKQPAKDFVSAPAIAAKQLLLSNGISKDRIALWEVDEPMAALPLAFIKQLKLDPARVNVHGGSIGLGHPIAMTGARLVTHLAHTLKPGEYGCAAVCNGVEGASALLLERLYWLPSRKDALPLITLYTKDPCPLCEAFLEELESYFSGQYELEKINITNDGNERFLRLYRYDIPVVFLNGQFLCMHKLNVNLLGRKLEELRENDSNI